MRLAKKILSHKHILANILHYCVPEFNNCSIEAIATRYIEGNPKPGVIPIDPDCTNAKSGDSIVGNINEDASINEGVIRFDVLFNAVAPKNGENILLTINVEAQSDYDPGYPIIKRAVYYGSRLISSQKGRDWVKSEYGKIHKVYTIWICMNPPEKEAAFINRYTFNEEKLFGNTSLNQEDFDLIDMIVVGLNDVRSEHVLIKMLSTVFSTRASFDEKKAALQINGIPYEIEVKEDIETMCNLSKIVLKEGVQQGLQQGLQQGQQTGDRNRLLSSVKALMDTTTNSFAVAAEMLKLTAEDIAFCKKELNIQ